ncbi:MAG: beta-ketoacyl-ACP synthase [bacterium]|nr:beta-ketoacyl-ACP synthase [bacterium]
MTITTDMQGRPVVAITGMGLVTSIGKGCDDNWKVLMDGTSGLSNITRFPIDGLRSSVAGTVDAFLPDAGQMHSVERSYKLAMNVTNEALDQASFDREQHFPGPLFMATPPPEFEWPQFARLNDAGDGEADAGYERMLAAVKIGKNYDEGELVRPGLIANKVAAKFRTTGLPISVCTACASGATAIGLGVEAIRRGEQAALCIGTDATVHQEAMVRFTLLSAVSTHNDPPEKASRPFDKTRAGFVIAEGAAALVLENYDHAIARGAQILGVVRGYGERADTFHRTRSMPDGSAMIGAMVNALDDGGVSPAEVDHVNAHGTSTPENDKMEALSLNEVFGDRVLDVPVASNKGQLGHTLLAAGAVEAVISLMTINNNIIPANMNYETPDPAINLDIVANKPREKNVNIILSNSFGFGGQNACLVFSSGDEYA